MKIKNLERAAEKVIEAIDYDLYKELYVYEETKEGKYIKEEIVNILTKTLELSPE